MIVTKFFVTFTKYFLQCIAVSTQCRTYLQYLAAPTFSKRIYTYLSIDWCLMYTFELCLAHSAHLPIRLYILLALISYLFFNFNFLTQDLLNWFSLLFQQMKSICVSFIDPDLFFLFHNERCHGNQFWAKLAKWPSFNTLAFRKSFEYRFSIYGW